jgi:hypothetical protein
VITGPDSLIGKGDSGPESGPVTESRGPSGLNVMVNLGDGGCMYE